MRREELRAVRYYCIEMRIGFDPRKNLKYCRASCGPSKFCPYVDSSGEVDYDGINTCERNPGKGELTEFIRQLHSQKQTGFRGLLSRLADIFK